MRIFTYFLFYSNIVCLGVNLTLISLGNKASAIALVVNTLAVFLLAITLFGPKTK